MKDFLIAFTLFLVWSFFGLWLYAWYQSDSKKNISKIESVKNITLESTNVPLKNNEMDSLVKTEPLDNPQNESSIITETDNTKTVGLKGINSNGDIIFGYSEGISILENSSEIFIPETVANFKNKIYSYLDEHPDQEVHINSLYSASENFESPNFGIKRGEKVKEVLLAVEIPREKIVVKPIITGINFNEEGFNTNSITFIFKSLDYNRLNNLKNSIPDKKVVYPEFSSSGVQINKRLETLLVEIKQIVKDNPDIRIELIGHTDNIGSSIDNQIMALNYSKQVRWYIISKGGIDKSKIKATSKGESEPIDSNQTERGRLANRRIEVIFY